MAYSKKPAWKKSSNIIQAVIGIAAVGVCAYLLPESIERWKGIIDSYFPPTEHRSKAPRQNIPEKYKIENHEPAQALPKTQSGTSIKKSIPRPPPNEKDVKEKTETLAPSSPVTQVASNSSFSLLSVPKPTDAQLLEGYEHVKAALDKGGVKFLPAIYWAADKANRDRFTYLQLLISESSLRNVKNKHTSADGAVQGTENFRIDVMNQSGRDCLPAIKEKDAWAASVMENYILPYICSSGDIAKGEKKFRNAALKSCGASDLPKLKEGASAKEHRTFQLAYKKAEKERQRLLDQWARKTLELKKFTGLRDLVFLVFKKPNAALVLTATHQGKYEAALRKYITENNPDGRAAQLMADPRYGSGFIAKLNHNLADDAKRCCGLPDATPLATVFDPETIKANGWSGIPTTGGLLDHIALKSWCFLNGINVYFSPELRDRYEKMADKKWAAKKKAGQGKFAALEPPKALSDAQPKEQAKLQSKPHPMVQQKEPVKTAQVNLQVKGTPTKAPRSTTISTNAKGPSQPASQKPRKDASYKDKSKRPEPQFRRVDPLRYCNK